MGRPVQDVGLEGRGEGTWGQHRGDPKGVGAGKREGEEGMGWRGAGGKGWGGPGGDGMESTGLEGMGRTKGRVRRGGPEGRDLGGTRGRGSGPGGR